jgi:hypothetical protein
MTSQGEKQLLSSLLEIKETTEGGNRKSIELQKTDDWFSNCRSQEVITRLLRILRDFLGNRPKVCIDLQIVDLTK